MSQSLTEIQIRAARSAITLLRHVIRRSDEMETHGLKRDRNTQEHYDRAVAIINEWDADEFPF